ncbi:adenine methyltransferase [Pseudomonas fluorescens NCIMB 11764]|uniref:site-specific DNA-methyltransferase (adenine-specific) n=1 Tax=Pseudomonas fluorescens NCIMB 11764 TaxID=1221522 RepID=A0A0K1QN64_PSEFL|nr:DNA adenine methylase [Pseudomonas fluorescens]AKV07196.1 adenine methyltransferase [Pseudomonas fluorescens NCIMB 11764]
MKYMGHKGKLLNFLGDILIEESKNSASIGDPFCGSGAVSWFLAQNTKKSVISGDLQEFAICRAASVTTRTAPVNASSIHGPWLKRAKRALSTIIEKFPNAERSIEPDVSRTEDIIKLIVRSRSFCEQVLPGLLKNLRRPFPMTKAYGGHYFSPMQALLLDALRSTLPKTEPDRSIALAALIETASRCAASPGHTAQPFQPTITSAKYVLEAWQRSVEKLLIESIESISTKHAHAIGHAAAGDFVNTIELLQEGDLVFADPPYSDVHYSRFYHVLETLAKGAEVEVTGRGRYPDIAERPSSMFSLRAKSRFAALDLIETCYRKKVGLVLTFPSYSASNGLSATDFIDAGRKLFSSIEQFEVDSDFSTLGGNAKTRSARLACQESIVCFRM